MDFQYIAMDTDSAYMALTGPLESIIREDRVDQYFAEYGKWFPRPYCDDHNAEFKRVKLSDNKEWKLEACCQKVYNYDLRTPGLFKDEFQGDGMVSLNSKTYCCWNDDKKTTKYSSKGLSKTTNNLTKEAFLKVLESQLSSGGINKGFVKKSNILYSYSQFKTGLTYFYSKRRVCIDGVSTECTAA
jgi:hypothetical protein